MQTKLEIKQRKTAVIFEGAVIPEHNNAAFARKHFQLNQFEAGFYL